MDKTVWINGEFVPWSKANIHLLSHGFSRASAVFEVFGIHKSPGGIVAFRMGEHLKRLSRTCELLGMELRYSSAQIVNAVKETVRANCLQRGLVKILAYWSEEAIINLVLDTKLDLAVFAIPNNPGLGLDINRPISACLSKWRKIHPETIPVEAKACANYLNGYLIRKDANSRGFDVGLAVGTDGFVAEGSIESVFIVKNGILKTPPSGRILFSISRLSILQVAKSIGIPTSEEALKPDDLYTADEIFTSHTGSKVLPVIRFEDRNLYAPGPITLRLMQSMNNILNFSDDHFKDWFQPL